MKKLTKYIIRSKQILLLLSISFLTIVMANEAKACICVAPTTVINLSASSITTSGFTLSWTASTTSCGTMGSYNIDISLTNFGASISGYPLNTGSTATTKVLSGLGCGTTYYVRMKAQLSNCGSMQSSSWSSVYSVTTASPCAASCTDGILNQTETAIDCGGPCLVCTCSDGKQNQGETGVDCGGPCVSCTPPAATTSSVGCPAAANSIVNPASCDQVGTTALDLSGGVVTYSNKGAATPSPAPTCGTASPTAGSWARYNIAAGVNTLNFSIDPGGSVDPGNHNAYAAFYQGTCASLTPINCLKAGETIMGTFYVSQLVVQGLNPAEDVYVFMWDDADKAFSLPYDVIGSTAPANDGCAGSVTSPDGCNLGSIGDQFATTYSPSWTGAGCVGCGPTYVSGNGALCGGGNWASNENTVWYTVIASATTASIDVDNIICNDGTAGSAQFAVFTSCACPTVLGWTGNACFKGCATGSGTLSLTGLTPGTTYYLAVDGFAGDVCKYTFTAPGLFLCADTVRPFVSSSIAGGPAKQKTFTITMNEPIQCSTMKSCGGCVTNNCTACDFALSQNGSTKSIAGYYIVSATATCVNDLTTSITITLNDTPAYTNGVADYDDLWKIVPNSTQGNINLRDTCNNFLLANSGVGALILPVELILFNGKYENSAIKLNWVTASEQNVATFIIEKSKDGFSFVELVKKEGGGNSSSIRSYFFTDNHPFAGLNYYRLYAVTYDGKKEIVGGIVSVEADDLQVFAFNSIQPMPAKDKIVISVNSDTEDTESELFIFDISGRQIYKENRPLFTGKNEIAMDIAFLNKGVYFVSFRKQGQSIHSKLVKY